MKIIIIVVIAIAIIAIGLLVVARKAGYRGAIGFKNRYPVEIVDVQLTGFSSRLECRSLTTGEHSFNYPGRQDIPTDVALRWRLAGESEERTTAVSLAGIPKDLRDGEIFFILTQNGTWIVEHGLELQLEKLQQGK